MWPPAHPLCRAKAGIGGMAWWEGGGDSWEGKEVRWSATDRLVRGPTVNLAAFRSLRPCTWWILADREGGGVAVEGKCDEKPFNCQLEYTPPTWWSHLQIDRADAETIARRPARLQPACSARRPARRCVVCTRVACHHPLRGMSHYSRNARIDVGLVRVDLTPIGARNPSCYSV